MLGVYHTTVIIIILRKFILIDQIFHFHRGQLILWWSSKESLGGAWLDFFHAQTLSGNLRISIVIQITCLQIEVSIDVSVKNCRF